MAQEEETLPRERIFLVFPYRETPLGVCHFSNHLYACADVYNKGIVTGKGNCMEVGNLGTATQTRITLEDKAHPKNLPYLRDVSIHVMRFMLESRKKANPEAKYSTLRPIPFYVRDVSVIFLYTLAYRGCTIMAFVQISNAGHRLMFYASDLIMHSSTSFGTTLDLVIGEHEDSIWKDKKMAKKTITALKGHLENAIGWRSHLVRPLEKILRELQEHADPELSDAYPDSLLHWPIRIGP